MPREDLKEEVKRFIIEQIHSVEQLEILLLLYRSGAREWTAEAVAGELRTHPASAARRLEDLQGRGLLSSRQGSYQYNPKSADLDRAVEGLSQIYPERRVTIIDLIFSKPLDNVRVFADAFKLRRDDDD